MVRDATASYSSEKMHPALDVNIPNYASAMVTTDEVPEDVHAIEIDRREECDRVAGHLCHGVRRRAAGTADARVVEQVHSPPYCECVDQRGVPEVEIAAEVLEQDQGHRVVPELAERVVDAVRCAHHLVWGTPSMKESSRLLPGRVRA